MSHNLHCQSLTKMQSTSTATKEQHNSSSRAFRQSGAVYGPDKRAQLIKTAVAPAKQTTQSPGIQLSGSRRKFLIPTKLGNPPSGSASNQKNEIWLKGGIRPSRCAALLTLQLCVRVYVWVGQKVTIARRCGLAVCLLVFIVCRYTQAQERVQIYAGRHNIQARIPGRTAGDCLGSAMMMRGLNLIRREVISLFVALYKELTRPSLSRGMRHVLRVQAALIVFPFLEITAFKAISENNIERDYKATPESNATGIYDVVYFFEVISWFQNGSARHQ